MLCVLCAISRARLRAGNSNAISSAMIEMTTSSSINVKPDVLR